MHNDPSAPLSAPLLRRPRPARGPQTGTEKILIRIRPIAPRTQRKPQAQEKPTATHELYYGMTATEADNLARCALVSPVVHFSRYDGLAVLVRPADTRNSRTRIYVSDSTDKVGRRNEAERAAARLGITGKLQWRAGAGCSCGCSPGFIVADGSLGLQVWAAAEAV